MHLLFYVSLLLSELDLKSPDELDELKAQAKRELEDEKKVKKKRNVAKIGMCQNLNSQKLNLKLHLAIQSVYILFLNQSMKDFNQNINTGSKLSSSTDTKQQCDFEKRFR